MKDETLKAAIVKILFEKHGYVSQDTVDSLFALFTSYREEDAST